MTALRTIKRRTLLRSGTAVAAGLAAGPALESWAWASPETLAFVDHYLTNTTSDLTTTGNAAVRLLSGMWRLWQTGEAWNSGSPLQPRVLRANMRHCVEATATRSPEQARQAFIVDRQHQSHAVIAGLGPLADFYRIGARAVTSITSAPETTPTTTISDAVPAGAPAGWAIGAGSTDSPLGAVVSLINTVRGPHASGNPSKFAFQYPRPWRMTEDSQVVETGTVDALGYPGYRSEVRVVPQLLRQRSTTPAEDGGFPSGHTNALYLAALALAHAVPERFQELVACASALSDTRIVAGMHSPVDVIGGRILGTALAAAALHDPANAALKSEARHQAASYLQTVTNTNPNTLYAFAHSTDAMADPYADRAANRAAVASRMTYTLLARGEARVMVVPKGAEVLLETRLPYLDVQQRREVLRTTSLPDGHPILDGPEQWGRLDLHAAADGYGTFEREVRVELDAAAGGFHAADTWHHDIDGRGSLTKAGTGTLTLTGTNRYSGGTLVETGTLVVGSPEALGHGRLRVRGGAVLRTTLRNDNQPSVIVRKSVSLDRDSVLELHLDPARVPRTGTTLAVIRASSLRGTFRSITVNLPGLRARPDYRPDGLSVQLLTT